MTCSPSSWNSLWRLLMVLFGTTAILSAQPSLTRRAQATDLGDVTLMPGLIDAHTHKLRHTEDSSQLKALAKDYAQLFLGSTPDLATWFGFHEFDDRLADFSIRARTARLKRIRLLLSKCDGLDATDLSMGDRHDLDLIRHALLSQRLDIEEIRQWERDPGIYLGTISEGITNLVIRDFAPEEARLKRVIQRLERVSPLLRDARRNLKAPPRVLTEMALDSIPDLIDLLERDTPLAFKGLKRSPLAKRFKTARASATSALRSYQSWLKEDLLPRSTGKVPWGAALLARALFLSDRVDAPLDRLWDIGMADLKRNQAALAQTAQAFHPGSDLEVVLQEVHRSHPSSDQLFATMEAHLQEARRFVEERHLATIPIPGLPKVVEMPPFLRATSQARMNTAGPFEKQADSYLYITSPDRSWPAEKVDQYLGHFNPGSLGNLAVHESFPGHFVSDSWLRRVPSTTRRLCMSGTYIEGWAHYAEQMMVEEGFRKTQPMHRIGQLEEALRRDTRLLVALGLHARGMSLEDAQALFVREANLPAVVADMEVRRASETPIDVMTYTIGKLQFLKLREDLRQKQGASFDLRRFHDAVLGAGILPLKLLREELLGEVGEDL